MTEISAYIAELIHSQLEYRKPIDIPDGIQIGELAEIARRNHMEYMILGALMKTSNLPEKYILPFRQRVMNSMFRTMAQVSELKALEECFEKNSIINQPLKGARLKFYYPAPEMREMSDIDVLIKEDNMDLAAEKLTEMGYSLNQAIKHHDIYSKEPYMVIEAHRAMYDKTVDKNQYEYFSNFSRAVLREGYCYTYDFNPDDFYIYMLAHMAKHFYVKGCGIRNLVDIYVYLNKFGSQLNREYLNKEFEKLKLRDFVEQCEALTFIWLGKKESTQFYDNLFDYMINCGIYGKDENGIWHKFAEDSQQGKNVSRFQLKLWYWFPPVHYMSEYYPWLEEKKWLLPVAWGIRAYRGIFLKKGVRKKQMLKEIKQDEILVYREIYQKMGLHFR